MLFRSLAAAAGTKLYIWDFSTTGAAPVTVLETKASLRCVRFLDDTRLLVGVRSRSNNVGMTSYIRAARAQLLTEARGLAWRAAGRRALYADLLPMTDMNMLKKIWMALM